jgi:hypothetical protein
MAFNPSRAPALASLEFVNDLFLGLYFDRRSNFLVKNFSEVGQCVKRSIAGCKRNKQGLPERVILFILRFRPI